MPSHLCKCGHCDLDQYAIKNYENQIIQQKVQIYNKIYLAFHNGNLKLNSINKSITSEEGKLIEKIRNEVAKLLSEMSNNPPTFEVIKEEKNEEPKTDNETEI
jgi:hypothetical protein